MRFEFAHIDGATTRYLIGGSGPGVILVHGVGMSADTWFWTIPELANQFRVAAPDLLDNGFTGAGKYIGGPPHPFIVEHLLRFADHLGMDRFSLVGSSLGAWMAALTYFRAPERIEKLVLVGPGLLLNPPDNGDDIYEATYKNGRSALENPTYESCRTRMQRAFFDPARVPETLVAMQMMMYASPDALERFERRMAGLRSAEAQAFRVDDKLERVGVPTLFLCGKEDIRGRYDEAVKGAMKIPNVRLLPYERCGHWPHIEHVQAFNRDVSAFLQGAG